MSASFGGRGYSSRPVKLNWVHVQEQQSQNKEVKFLMKVAQKPEAPIRLLGSLKIKVIIHVNQSLYLC